MAGILTVCTANVCRSTGAAALLGSLLPSTVVVSSAGVAAHEGQEQCPVMAEWLADPVGDGDAPHRSRQLTADIVDTAELVLTASLRQRKLVLALAPQAVVFTMREAAELARQVDHAESGAGGSPVVRFAHDLTVLRHRTRFADGRRESLTVQRAGGTRRWFGRSLHTDQLTVSPYDVPDAHAAALHGDHAFTFATLRPAIEAIADGLLGYRDPGRPTTASGDGRQ